MDKKEWELSLGGLKNLLKQREKDIEELKVTIKAYEKKIKSLR
jgi:hypothetical protein